MNPESMQSMNVQAQIRRNAEEQSNFLQSLGQWEKDVKVKDADMKRARKVKVREANKKNGGPSAKPRESGGTVTIRQATKEDFEVSGEVQATVDSKKRKDDEKVRGNHFYGTTFTFTFTFTFTYIHTIHERTKSGPAISPLVHTV